MARFNTFPDFEAIIAATLRAASITDLGVRVYSSIPTNPTFPLVTVKRIGGSPRVRQYLDGANLQIDVWGGTKAQARDIAAACRTTIFLLEGTQVSSPVSAWISGVDDSLGLTWLPDQETGRDRYLFSVLVAGR